MGRTTYINGRRRKSIFQLARRDMDSMVDALPDLYRGSMKPQKANPTNAPDPATLAPKASAADLTLHSRTIGVLPIINRLIERCQLRETLGRYLPADDDASRVKAIGKTTDDLMKLRTRLQSPRSRMRERHRVEQEVDKILARRGTSELLKIDILREEEVRLKQSTPGRRTKNTQYTREVKNRFDLTWQVDSAAIERARRADGVFPLITNDRAMTAEEVLRAYKRQPIIEKRFSQLKTDFVVAPVYLKEVSRIESLLCVYFMVLLLQTLLERELRDVMHQQEIESLPLYPEGRGCRHPTARRVIDVLENVTRHRLVTDEGDTLDLYTDATPIQSQLIKLFGFKPSTYGRLA